MKYFRVFILFISTFILTNTAFAEPSLREAQACQGVMLFLDDRLDKAEDIYPARSIKLVRKGLEEYSAYIDNDVMPALIKQYAQGDSAKQNTLEKQIDAANINIVNQYNQRYQDNRLYTDFAMAINECAKQGVISQDPDEQENLKAALLEIIELAKKS